MTGKVCRTRVLRSTRSRSADKMLGSFLEGAKATVRRAGAGDQAPVTDDPARDALKKSGAASVSGADRGRKVVGGVQVAPAASAAEGGDGAAAAGRDNDVGLSATESMSRSFSLLRASGARVMQPVKKALGADPEVVEARARLTKYKASLSSAVAEAAATAATRREERDLLTKALAVQENDLRCWGYLSVLPCFREHRRLETNRAQLRVSMSERREEVISAKFQEVVRLLRSMPIIGPWTNKPQPSPEAEVDSLLAVGAGARDGGGGGSGGAGGGAGGGASSGDGHGNDGDGGRYFFEDSFAVAPADLLAFDEKLALTRRRLRVCDRACAAAADAFAMKVVAAGGLEPRSTEDRAETLLSLVSRYHNLEVEEATADKGETCERKDRRGMREPATAGRRAAPAADVGSQTGGSSNSVAAHLKQEEVGDGENQEDGPRRENGAAMTASDDGSDGADDESGSGGGVSGGGGRGGRGDGGDRSPGSTGHATEDREHRRPAEDQEGSTGALLEGGGGDDASGDVGSGKVREGQSGGGEGAAARTVGGRFSRRSRKECEEAFFELMLDERNREGRLLRRFLTMAQAKKSPPSSSLASSSASSRTLSLSSSSSSSSAAAPRPGAHQKPSEAAGVASASSVGGSLAAAAAGAFSSLRWRAKGSGSGGGGGSAADNTPVVAREGGAATAGVGKADIDAKAKIATNENSYSGAAGSTRPGAAAAVTGKRPPQSSAGRAGVAEAGPGRMGHPARGDGRAREVKEEEDG
ncbi:unnamed protein product, partial [Scytosiphon promiscuus]